MKLYHKQYIAMILCTTLLCGCGADSLQVSEENTEPEILSWFTGEYFDFAYELPESRSYISVDQYGYLPMAEKKAAAFHIVEDAEFQVVNTQTKEVVYKGTWKKTDRTLDSGETVFIGDFTDVTTPGTYVVQSKHLGSSYAFNIQDGIYEQATFELLQKLEQIDWNQDIYESCAILGNLCLAYELNHSFFAEKDTEQKCINQIKQGIDTLVTYQNHQTGAVLDTPVTDLTSNEVDDELTAIFAGILAKFSFIYKEYDNQVATDYLKYAELSWQNLNKRGRINKMSQNELYFATTELYRVTNKSKYYSVIHTLQNQYDSETGKVINPFIDRMYETSENGIRAAFWGNITYLTTTNYVNMDRCTLIMKSLTQEATKITEESKKQPFLTREENVSTALNDAFIIAFALCVNDNYEYNCILQNQFHYMNGFNSNNQSYLELFGTKLQENLLTNSNLRISQLILVISST